MWWNSPLVIRGCKWESADNLIQVFVKKKNENFDWRVRLFRILSRNRTKLNAKDSCDRFHLSELSMEYQPFRCDIAESQIQMKARWEWETQRSNGQRKRENDTTHHTTHFVFISICTSTELRIALQIRYEIWKKNWTMLFFLYSFNWRLTHTYSRMKQQ